MNDDIANIFHLMVLTLACELFDRAIQFHHVRYMVNKRMYVRCEPCVFVPLTLITQ